MNPKKCDPKKDHFLATMLRRGFENGRVDEFILAQPDWGYLLERSVEEGVFHPFYKNLLMLDNKGRLIPDEFREKYAEMHYFHIAKSAEFFASVERTLTILDSLNIKILLVKGPVVDTCIYDGFMRPRLDLDIVVAPGSRQAIENVFKSTPADDHVRVHIHEHLINNTFLTVDGTLRMDMNRVWQETEPFKKYRNIVILKPELTILYMTEHALKHDLDQLIFLYEIERMINFYKDKFDWKRFIALADEFVMKRIAYHSLFFVKTILLGDIPDEVMKAIAPRKLTLGEKIFRKDVLAKSQRRYESYLVYFAARDGYLKKANFLFRTITRRLILR